MGKSICYCILPYLYLIFMLAKCVFSKYCKILFSIHFWQILISSDQWHIFFTEKVHLRKCCFTTIRIFLLDDLQLHIWKIPKLRDLSNAVWMWDVSCEIVWKSRNICLTYRFWLFRLMGLKRTYYCQIALSTYTFHSIVYMLDYEWCYLNVCGLTHISSLVFCFSSSCKFSNCYTL